MTASPAPGSAMTADEVMALPDAGVMYELDEGRFVISSPGAYWSSIVALAFGERIAPFVRSHRLGPCAGPDGTLDGGDLLPGLTLSPAEFWAKLDEEL